MPCDMFMFMCKLIHRGPCGKIDITIYLSSINHEPSILTMRRDGQKRKIIRKMCI